MSHQDQRAHKEMLLKQATKTKELVCGVVSESGVMFCNMSEPVPEKPHVFFHARWRACHTSTGWELIDRPVK